MRKIEKKSELMIANVIIQIIIRMRSSLIQNDVDVPACIFVDVSRSVVSKQSTYLLNRDERVGILKIRLMERLKVNIFEGFYYTFKALSFVMSRS